MLAYRHQISGGHEGRCEKGSQTISCNSWSSESSRSQSQVRCIGTWSPQPSSSSLNQSAQPPPRTFSAFAHHYTIERGLAQKDATPSSHPSDQSAQRFHAPVASCRQSLATWFSVGLLQLQPIHWESSSAALLEKVMAYEAVHPMQGWQDLQQRLGPMRRYPALHWPQRTNKSLFLLHNIQSVLQVTLSVCNSTACYIHAVQPACHILQCNCQVRNALLHTI